MSLHYKVGGSWKEIRETYVKINGVWHQCKNIYVHQNGAWYPVLMYQISAALPSLKNDTTVSITYSDVVVGSTMQLTYNVVNNVYDGSDYAGVGLDGAYFPTNDNWKLGPNGGTWGNTCTVTAPTVTVRIWGHGLTSAKGTINYYTNK